MGDLNTGNEFVIRLTKKQQEIWDLFFNKSSDELIWIVSVGGKGSAKTTLAVYMLIYMLLDERFKNSKILIARESLRDLKNTLVLELQRYLNLIGIHKSRDFIYINDAQQYIQNKDTNTFIYYLSLSDKNDQYKSILSYEFNVVIVDEADRISYEAFMEINARLRHPHHFTRGMLILNPTSEEHWIYKHFVIEPFPKSIVIHSSSYDNYFRDEIHIDDLREMNRYEAPDGKVYFYKDNIRYEFLGLKKDAPHIAVVKKFNLPHSFYVNLESRKFAYRYVMLYGNWGNIFDESGFFSDVFTEQHIIRDKPESLYLVRFYVGMDFGFRHPAVVLVGETYIGQLVILDAGLYNNLTIKQFFEEVRNMLWQYKISEDNVVFYGDIAGTQREQSDGISLIRKLENEYGVRIRTNKINFRESVDLLHQALQMNLSQYNKVYKVVVHENAKLVIEGFMGGFKIKVGYEKDKDDYYEHIFDALRYVLYPLLKNLHAKKNIYFKKPSL